MSTGRTFRTSLAALERAQKSPRGVSAYSRLVNRPAGRVLAAAADSLGLGPTAVTVLSGVLSLAAVVLIAVATPSIAVGVLAAALLVGGFALDSADGQIARLRGTSSRAGEWLDHTLDCAIKLTLPLAVAVAWYRLDKPGGLLLVALAFQVVSVLLFFGGTLAGKLVTRATPDGSRADERDGGRGRARSFMLLPVDHGIVSCSFVLWGWSSLFVAWYIVLLVAHVVYLAAFSTSWFRELS